MSAEDDVEIRKLIYRAASTFDNAQFDELGRLFARAIYDIGGRLAEPMVGSEGIAEFIRTRVILYKGKPRTQHRIANCLIEVAPDGGTATASSYVVVLQGLDGVLTPIIAGCYNDTFARDGEGWYFTGRTGSSGMLGDVSRHLHPLGETG